MISYKAISCGWERGVLVEDFSRSLGRLVSDWRRRSGMSQAALADALGTQQATISKLENGSNRITVASLSQILCACGLSFSEVGGDLDSLLACEPLPLWERIDE